MEVLEQQCANLAVSFYVAVDRVEDGKRVINVRVSPAFRSAKEAEVWNQNHPIAGAYLTQSNSFVQP